MNHCGTCTACCKVFAIAELAKPAGEWCTHCDVGVGCKVYDKRPEPCVDFQCLWLLSQSKGDHARLPLEMRPDKSKVVFSPSTNPRVMSAITMSGAPLAWRRDDVRHLITTLVRAGIAVVVGPATSTRKVMISPDGEKEVRLTEPDAEGMQWSIPETVRATPAG